VIAWLDDPRAVDPARTGGKAAVLARLAAVWPVPQGFVLEARSLSSAANGDVSGLLAAVDAAYAELGRRLGADDPAVAVRSSGVDEDGAASSFAGVLESFVNVTGATDLREAVRACWASGATDRARAYRTARGLEPAPRLAVLVQELVRADVSAVAFTAHPVSGRRDQVVVTASYGLGESVVGGTVTPDTWILDCARLSISTLEIGAKERMTVPVAGGTREVAVPALLRSSPCLSEEQVRRMAGLALDLERHAGFPVDVELALAGERLVVLQCRPITALDRGSPPWREAAR
jgi:pyruvate,water dikinase